MILKLQREAFLFKNYTPPRAESIDQEKSANPAKTQNRKPYYGNTCKIKRNAPINMMRPRTSKDAIEFVFCWPSTAGHVPLRIASFPSETPLEKTKCSFASGYQLETASGLGVKYMYTFLLSSRTPSGAALCRPCACCHRLCEFICALVSVFWSFPNLWFFWSFELLFSRVFWVERRMDWWISPI